MKPLKVYQINYCPKYIHSEDQTINRIEDNLNEQSALWSAIRTMQRQNSDLSAELRFVSSGMSDPIAVYLVIHQHSDTSVAQFDIIERLLPSEYGWQAVSTDAIDPSIIHPKNNKWRVARLIRNIEYMDIPAPYLWFFGQMQGQISNEQLRQEVPEDNCSNKSFNPPENKDISTFAENYTTVVKSKNRRLPFPGLEAKKQMETAQICVPFSGSLISNKRDRNLLYMEMKHSGPVIVSISLHPIEIAALDDDRVIATHFQQYASLLNYPAADYIQSQLQSEGLARVRELRSTYERYLMPNNHLCNLTIRVAGRDNISAMKVAHCLCACIGGLRIFDILSPTRDIQTSELTFLSNPSIDIPTLEMLSNTKYQETWSSILKQRLSQIGLEYQKSFEGFLLRMPHMYSMEEADRMIQLPVANEDGVIGISTRMVAPFYSTISDTQPFQEKPQHRIRLGMIKDPLCIQLNNNQNDHDESSQWHTYQWHSLPVDDLCKHAFIVGSTGSGKTVTTQFIARELVRTNIPFLVIEPVKTEYFQNLKSFIPDLQRFRFDYSTNGEKTMDYLIFDPMRLQKGVTVSRHISYLKSCFQAAFPMTDILSLVLENGLHEYYTRSKEKGGCGLNYFQRGGTGCHFIDQSTKHVVPSFAHFTTFFLNTYLNEELTPNSIGSIPHNAFELLFTWKLAFKRRFQNLFNSPLGMAFRRSDELVRQKGVEFFNQFPVLLRQPTILELDAISDNEQKSLIMSFLLTFLFEHRQTQQMASKENGYQSTHLSHVLFIEEAHRLLSRSSQNVSRGSDIVGQNPSAKAISLFVDMLAEIRAYGQGVAIIEQIPTKIIPDAVKNANLKIMMKMTAEEDRNYLGESMNFNTIQKKFVTHLKPGQYIAFEENLDQPVYLELPMQEQWKSLNIF